MQKLKTDVCVIGAGSGGLSVAAGAVQMGAKAVLIEHHKMGGECLNFGCVPSKAIISFSRSASKPSYQDVYNYIKHTQAKIAPHDSAKRFSKLGVKVLRGTAKFINSKQLKIGAKIINARYFVIATGSSPALPPVLGLAATPYLTNETIFELKEQPKHLIIIGGGPIGCEMAQAHRNLGTKVSVIQHSTILNKDDPELVDVVRQQFIKDGIKLYENTAIKRISYKDKFTIKLNNKTISGSHLLVASGRIPNIEKLNLAAAKVNFSKQGIVVAADMRSSNKRIFAVGDVVEGYKFTHVANYQAGIILRRMLFHLPAKTNYRALPWVTFTSPELANVGMHEAEARIHHKNIKVLTAYFVDNDRAVTENETTGFIKAITTKKGKILGASIVGKNAGEIIQPWILAMSQGLTIKSLTQMIVPYPTRGEINKQAAGKFYTPLLFSKLVRRIVRFLM